MANIASAKKRIRSTNRKTIINKNRVSKIRTYERKVEEAIKISKMGMNVFFVNGKKPERIVAAVKNREFKGTMFRGKRNA